MTIDEIREKIAEKLQYHESFISALDNTSPGHYGVEDFDTSISLNDIFVDIQNRTYTFKHVNFSFTLQLASSSEKDGYQDSFSKLTTGSGEFRFSADGKDIEIYDNTVELESSELYDDE